MSNFTSNLPAIFDPPLSSKSSYMPRNIMGIFSIIWSQILSYINYIPQLILETFLINVSPPFLDISYNYSYTPQQTMIIYPTVWDIQLTNMGFDYSYIPQQKKKIVLAVLDRKALQKGDQIEGLQNGWRFYVHLMSNFTSNLSTLWNPPLFNISSNYSYIPQQIIEVLPTISSKILSIIRYIPHQILLIFLTMVFPSFLDISSNYSYTPQQTMTIFPTESGIQLTNISTNYTPQQKTEILTTLDQPLSNINFDTILDHPLLNINFDYAYLPQQIIALKCYLATRHLRQRNFPLEKLDLIFVIIENICIHPYIQLHLLLNSVIDYGVFFSYYYVKVTYFLHKHLQYTAYNLVLFFACVLCKKFEFALDLCIIFVSISEIYLNPVELIIANMIFAFKASTFFFSLWWMNYSHKVHSLLLVLIGIFLADFTPRDFTGTLLMLVYYRLLGNPRMYV